MGSNSSSVINRSSVRVVAEVWPILRTPHEVPMGFSPHGRNFVGPDWLPLTCVSLADCGRSFSDRKGTVVPALPNPSTPLLRSITQRCRFNISNPNKKSTSLFCRYGGRGGQGQDYTQRRQGREAEFKFILDARRDAFLLARASVPSDNICCGMPRSEHEVPHTIIGFGRIWPETPRRWDMSHVVPQITLADCLSPYPLEA